MVQIQISPVLTALHQVVDACQKFIFQIFFALAGKAKRKRWPLCVFRVSLLECQSLWARSPHIRCVGHRTFIGGRREQAALGAAGDRLREGDGARRPSWVTFDRPMHPGPSVTPRIEEAKPICLRLAARQPITDWGTFERCPLWYPLKALCTEPRCHMFNLLTTERIAELMT